MGICFIIADFYKMAYNFFYIAVFAIQVKKKKKSD